MTIERYRRGMLVLATACAVACTGALLSGCGDDVQPAAAVTPTMMPMPAEIPPPRPDVHDDATPTNSALWTPYHYVVYDFVVGSVSDAVNRDGPYICANTVSYRMYTTIYQSYDGFPPPGTMPAVWHTTVGGSFAYLFNNPDRAVSTISCPTATMAYSSQYAVLYNTAVLSCNVYGHVANGPVKSWPVTVPVAGLQQVGGTNAFAPYWVVGYSGATPWPDGNGYCGPVSRTFGS